MDTSGDAEGFECDYVHSVYEDIAPHFSCTRYKPWPKVKGFLQDIPHGSLVADVGCGNGKNLGCCPGSYILGSDRSSEMVKICAGNGLESMVCDGMRTPYRSAAFDYVISIAVIHHWSTDARRLAALQVCLSVVRDLLSHSTGNPSLPRKCPPPGPLHRGWQWSCGTIFEDRNYVIVLSRDICVTAVAV